MATMEDTKLIVLRVTIIISPTESTVGQVAGSCIDHYVVSSTCLDVTLQELI